MKNFLGEPAPPVRARALDEVPERVRQIAMLRGLGYSYRQIAGPLHVTPQAVSLMLTRHRRSLKSLRDAMELNSLSARAVNVLGRHGIRTREQARQSQRARTSRRRAQLWTKNDGRNRPLDGTRNEISRRAQRHSGWRRTRLTRCCRHHEIISEGRNRLHRRSTPSLLYIEKKNQPLNS
jgi:predicted transcriptional regulator